MRVKAGSILLIALVMASLIGSSFNPFLAQAQLRAANYATANYGGGMSYATIGIVQGPFRQTATSGTTLVITMTNNAGVGNTIILSVMLHAGSSLTVSSVACTGVTWSKVDSQSVGSTYYVDEELWKGIVGAGAAKTITITSSGSMADGAANCIEFSNIEGVDTTKWTVSTSTTTPVTIGPIGATGGTNYAPRTAASLWVASFAQSNNAGATVSDPTNGFTLVDGAAIGTYWCDAIIYRNNAVGSGGVATTQVTLTGASSWTGISFYSFYPTRSTASITIAAVPSGGSVIVLVYSEGDAYCLSTPSCTGLTFHWVASAYHATNFQNVTLFYATSSGSGTSISFTTTNALWLYAMVYVYDGTLVLDQKAVSNTQNAAGIATGTTSATTAYNEVGIAGTVLDMAVAAPTASNSYTVERTTATNYPATLSLSDKSLTTLATQTTTATHSGAMPGAGLIATFYFSSFNAGNWYKFSCENEDGTTCASLSVTETDSGSSSAAFTIGSVPCAYSFINPITLLTWTVTGSLPRQLYGPITIGSTYVLWQAESAATLFNIQFKDLSNIFAQGAATLRISKLVGGVLQVITLFPVPDTIASNPAALVPNDIYSLDLIDAGGVTHALGNLIPLTSAQTPTFLLASTSWANLAQFVVSGVSASCTRNSPYTTITVNYQNTLTNYSTPWARIDFKLRDGTIEHTIFTSGNTITASWTGATAKTDYVVTLRVYHTFYTNLTKAFLASGTPVNYGTVPSLAGIGTFGSLGGGVIIGVLLVLCIAGLADQRNVGASAVLVVVVSGILASLGFIVMGATTFTVGLTFAILIAVGNRGRG